MKLVTREELRKMLAELKGNTFATIVSETVPKMLKTGNPFINRVKKTSRTNVAIGFNYTNSVNNQLLREGKENDFEALPRKWGERIKGTPLVEHKGKCYLECKIEKSIDYVYTLDGEEIGIELIQEFLPAKSESRQGTEKEIFVRDYDLESIRQITMKGEVYQVVQ